MTRFVADCLQRRRRESSWSLAELSDARVICQLRFHFAIEIHFQSESCGVEDGAAVCTVPQVALDLTRYLRC
jgi:hypothetical protein